MTGRWGAQEGHLSPLLIRSLIEYARKRGRTNLDQITDGFIAEWSGSFLCAQRGNGDSF
jgi:hypothetical protein